MNASKLAKIEGYRMRLFPVAHRRMVDGTWLPSNDDDWIVDRSETSGVVILRNVRTAHIATLGADRIHHFDHEPHRDSNGLKHGIIELRVRLVLQGPNIHYVPLPNFWPRQRKVLALKNML